MKITEILKDKRILLWGYGLEGKSTEKFIRTCCDVRELTVFQGKRDEIDEDAYDYIIKSPGIVAENLSGKFTSMTELFLTEFSGQVIGITGTKGKSTTSSLMYTVLSKCTDRPTLLVGNILRDVLSPAGPYQNIAPYRALLKPLRRAPRLLRHDGQVLPRQVQYHAAPEAGRLLLRRQ